MKIIGARVFEPDGSFVQRDINIYEDRIVKNSEDDVVFDAAGLTAIPGLIDIHLHGAMGHDVCDASLDGLRAISEYEAQSGVLCFCPTTMTLSEEKLNRVIDSINEFASSKGNGATVVGINLEGPFINANKCGAQNKEYIMPLEVDFFRRLQKRSGGKIKLLDIAPELDEDNSFIRTLSDEVKLSLAHSEADYDVATRAFSSGIKHVTHLYNAMNGISHRCPGPIIAAWEAGCEAELISDGIHVASSVVRFTFNIWDSNRLILISDSMRGCGLGDGEYNLGGQEVLVNGNRAVLKDNSKTIAGSVTNLYSCMLQAMSFGVEPNKAIQAATINPARSIGIDSDYGSIEIGKKANILLVDNDYRIKHIINNGLLLRE